MLLLCAGLPAHAADDAKKEGAGAGPKWYALVEPKFMHPPISEPVPRAEDTVFTAGTVVDGVVQYLKPTDIHGLHWDQFLEKVRPLASEELAKLEPEYRRDEHKVIQCAVLKSDRQTTSTAVFAPEFLAKFTPVFGPKLYVSIPNRFTIYVFPVLASKYQDYADEILAAYHNSTYPVTREVLELSTTGMRAAGVYEEP